MKKMVEVLKEERKREEKKTQEFKEEVSQQENEIKKIDEDALKEKEK